MTAGLILAVGACSFDEVLTVENPDELLEDNLNNPRFIDVLVASVKGDLAEALDDPFIWRGSMFTDETLTGINWEATARLNERIVSFDEGDPDLMFTELSRARSQGDSVSGRLKNLLDNPSSDARLATTLAHAGYAYIFLADAMCEATVNSESSLYTPTELYAIAVQRFEEAVPIAQAAGDNDVLNLARVGLSRAHLNLGNYGDVQTFAAQVPSDFRYYAEYSEADPAVDNTVAGRTQGSNHSLSVHPKFLASPENYGSTTYDMTADLTDPRVQHDPMFRFGHNQLTRIYTPFAPLMWSTYNGQTIAAGGNPSDMRTENDGADIAFASGLEAQHNMMEAMLGQGGGEAAVLGFVNERRAFGNQAAVTLSGAALEDELRDQRGRDLYLAGYRLGDLRRWLRNGDDLFPTGPHPVTEWGNYGNATCFPLPLEEYEGNPNLDVPG
ncbi:MAG: RagB/SusD family nutrient uptake outer membrane protein [Gemmatimonadetes bacterium]|nr:RagB/SusD family nutrient uptake outer membrane protein [Gemmatimonadota bacterium]